MQYVTAWAFPCWWFGTSNKAFGGWLLFQLGHSIVSNGYKKSPYKVLSNFVFNSIRWFEDCCRYNDRRMKSVLSCGLLLAICLPVQATTLQRLGLDDMIQKSTAIVRGTVQQTYSAVHNSVIYTHYQVSVSEVWKGLVGSKVDIAVPGGVVKGMRETYSGAPTFANGHEYVLYLWTSKSGLTQVIGLSQGLFDILPNSSGETVATRAATTERMVDETGQDVTDSDFRMRISEMRTRVQNGLERARGR